MDPQCHGVVTAVSGWRAKLNWEYNEYMIHVEICTNTIIQSKTLQYHNHIKYTLLLQIYIYMYIYIYVYILFIDTHDVLLLQVPGPWWATTPATVATTAPTKAAASAVAASPWGRCGDACRTGSIGCYQRPGVSNTTSCITTASARRDTVFGWVWIPEMWKNPWVFLKNESTIGGWTELGELGVSLFSLLKCGNKWAMNWVSLLRMMVETGNGWSCRENRCVVLWCLGPLNMEKIW